MPSSSVSLRARSSSVPPTAVMPIALITGIALGIGFLFFIFDARHIHIIDMPLAQERQTRTPPFIAIICLSILATMPGRDWECFREDMHLLRSSSLS